MMLLATFPDGSVLDVTESSNVSYQSTNPSIATVDQFGTTTAVSPGSASIVITYTNPTGGPNLQKSVPVTVLTPAVTVSSSSLTFGADLGLRVGGSETQHLMLQNTTLINSSLTITSISAVGDYAETDNCVTSLPLPVSGTCTVDVTFTPTAQGERTGTLTIVNNSSSVATAISLNGFAGANFDFSVAPSSQSVSPGNTANYAVTLSTFAGFSGDVSLAASGLPQGVTGTFAPGSLVNNGDVSTLVLAVPAGTPSGDYSFVITGTDDNLSVSQNAQLSVGAAVQDFTLTATPATQQVLVGGTTTYTVTVGAVDGFTGTVTPSVTGLPAGTTATFSPTTVAGAGTTTLTVATSATTPAADASLTITGTSGSDVHSTPVMLSVADFGVSVTPASQTVTAGSSTTYTITTTAVNGFTGKVTPTATGLPAGATATFSPATITGSGTAILTVSTTSATLGANSTLTITGTSGPGVHIVTTTLGVNNFTVTATPAKQQVVIGGSTSYTVTVGAVNGFAGTVTPTISGLPAGTTASFSPATIAEEGTTTLTIVTSGATPAVDASLTISGTSGSDAQSTQVTLSVVDFSVSVTPASQTVSSGQNGTFNVTVSPVNGFTGLVDIACNFTPEGPTLSGCPPSVNIASGAATFSVTAPTAGQPLQSYTLSIQGTNAAVASNVHTATATMSVQPLILHPTFFIPGLLGEYSNAAKAEDGDSNTFASGPENTAAGTNSGTWGGFAPVTGTPTQILLKVTSASNCSASDDGIEIAYSLNGGPDLPIYSIGFIGSGPAVRALQTDVKSLPVPLNTADVDVVAMAKSPEFAACHQIYDIWMEVTF
ncbi:MAG TPA: Ig-like domain-containing protein [Candidatus Angelobacter sp.]|nr:Ig-like domain-containing protein [Candidatus Angelobacter sp.]